MPASLELFWIPLGAGNPIVRVSGRAYEALSALVQRRRRGELFHSALIATTEAGPTAIEMTPIRDHRGAERGVVAEGAVGMRGLGRSRIFRYEIRRWPGGLIPDLAYAVSSPVQITDDADSVRRALDLVPLVPTPVWGRDELGAGEMWNSNSVISWVLARAGLIDQAGRPPGNGRAPGWEAGVRVASSGN